MLSKVCCRLARACSEDQILRESMLIEPSFIYYWLFGSWKDHEFTFRPESHDLLLEFLSISYLWMNFGAGERSSSCMTVISVVTLCWQPVNI